MVKNYYKLIKAHRLASSKKEAIELAKMTAFVVKESQKMGLSVDEFLKMAKERECGEYGFGGDYWKNA